MHAQAQLQAGADGHSIDLADCPRYRRRRSAAPSRAEPKVHTSNSDAVHANCIFQTQNPGAGSRWVHPDPGHVSLSVSHLASLPRLGWGADRGAASNPCLASATAVGTLSWDDWQRVGAQQVGAHRPLPPRAHAGRVQLPQGRPRQTGKGPIRRAWLPLSGAVMGRVSGNRPWAIHALADPISPRCYDAVSTCAPPSRHLLSSYGSLPLS